MPGLADVPEWSPQYFKFSMWVLVESATLTIRKITMFVHRPVGAVTVSPTGLDCCVSLGDFWIVFPFSSFLSRRNLAWHHVAWIALQDGARTR
jgi:hypothetical protein